MLKNLVNKNQDFCSTKYYQIPSKHIYKFSHNNSMFRPYHSYDIQDSDLKIKTTSKINNYIYRTLCAIWQNNSRTTYGNFCLFGTHLVMLVQGLLLIWHSGIIPMMLGDLVGQ